MTRLLQARSLYRSSRIKNNHFLTTDSNYYNSIQQRFAEFTTGRTDTKKSIYRCKQLALDLALCIVHSYFDTLY